MSLQCDPDIGRALGGEEPSRLNKTAPCSLQVRGGTELRRRRNLCSATTTNSVPLTHSMADITPSIDTRRMLQRRPILILALDGGGVRGLSSLILLRGLMERVAVARNTSTHEPMTVRPSEYFDLIIGAGTGGICALFLGRLRMTVDEAISAYQELVEAAFQPPSSFSSSFQRASSSQKLEKCVGDIIQRFLDDRNAPLSDPAGGSYTCRTAVLATTPAYIDAPPHIFRSYVTSEPPSLFLVHEVARAAVAIPGTSHSVSLGNPSIQFTSADVFGYNNPAEVGFSEAEENIPGRVACLVSLGAGLQKVVHVDSQRKTFSTARIRISSDCESVHDRMRRYGRTRNLDYFRFNVTHGLEDDIQEWTPLDSGHIAGITEGYMRNDQVTGSLNSCAQRLVGERKYDLIWFILNNSNSSISGSKIARDFSRNI